MINWECSQCGYRVLLPETYSGKRLKCPHCGHIDRTDSTQKQRSSAPHDQSEVMRCPYCRELIRVDARKCKHCGEILDSSLKEQRWNVGGDALVRCVACGGKVSASAMNCPHCGRPSPTVSAPISDKSRLAAGLLGIFLGGFGVHRFYLGYIGIGIIQLILTLVTFGFASIWGFIEGIIILAAGMNDADGKRVLRW